MFKIKIGLLLLTLLSNACLSEMKGDDVSTKKQPTPAEKVFEENDPSEKNENEQTSQTEITSDESLTEPEGPAPAQKSPQTVKEYFMLLPEKYFLIECCQGNKKAYLKEYLTVEDNKNGYLDGGGDGAQSTFRMALFKRPDKTYIIAFNVFSESRDDYYFLDYNKGKWKDISSQVIPEFSKMKIYEIPRYGTKMPVFAKRVIDSDGEYDLTEKGEKLYDLVWKNGKFTIKK